MIDLKALRNDPDYFRRGAEAKGTVVAIDELLELDAQKRSLLVADGIGPSRTEEVGEGNRASYGAVERGHQESFR